MVLIKVSGGGLAFWMFPGGAVEVGESDAEALTRECKEELGVSVAVGQLLGNVTISEPDVMQDVYLYQCQVVRGKLGTGNGPEFTGAYEGTYEVQVVPVTDVSHLPMYPNEAKKVLGLKCAGQDRLAA